MSDREIITMDELSAWLTRVVEKHEDCEGTTVSIKYKLDELDLDGCNWSEDVVCNLGENADKHIVTDLVGNAVREARKKFNLT